MAIRLVSTKKVLLLLQLVITGLFAGKLFAINVDSEIVILVDAQANNSQPQSDFDLILESVATAFEDQSFIDSVAAGTHGSIATTLILFNSGNSGETIAVPWMELSSAADLQTFANSVRAASNPTPWGGVSYGGAISEGAAQIASNSFQGTTRQLSLLDDGTGFYAADPIGTQSARDAALATSVDVINAVVFDVQYQTTLVEAYYNANIVGGVGSVANVIATPQGGNKTAAELAAIISPITESVTGPTTVAAVPEPSSILFLLTAGTGILIRRRR